MSHVLRAGVSDQIAYFRAYNTDGTAKTDLTSATTGLSLSAFRIGLSEVPITSLSDKASDSATHADGAIRQVAGNLYTVDVPDAVAATSTPSVGVRGSFTGGVIEPISHPVVGYNPTLAAVGANTVTPPTVAEMNARTLPSADYFDPAADGVNVTKVGGTTVAGPSDLKADVSGLSTFDHTTDSVSLQADQPVNVTKVGGTSVSGPSDLKADVSGLSTFNPATDAVALQADQQVNVTKLQSVPVLVPIATSVSFPEAVGTSTLTPTSINTALNTYGAAKTSEVNDVPANVWGHTTRTLSAFGFSVTVGTNNDKSGYALTQGFPANFSLLGINASGHISRVVLVDTTTTNTDMRGTDGALLSGSYTAPANSDIAAIKAVTDKLDTGLVADGLVYQWTANALELGPAGGGGGGVADWTADQKAAIITILGIPTSGTTPAVPTAGALFAMAGSIDNVPTVDEFNARSLPAAEYFDPVNDPVNMNRVAGTTVAGPNDLKANVTGLATTVQLAQSTNTLFGLIAQVLLETTSALTKLGGISFLKNWLAAIMGKSVDATTLAEINATTAGATYSNVTDSNEAIRDRGDAAWTGGGGGGGGETVIVLPTNGRIPDRGTPTNLKVFYGETIEQLISIFQADGTTPVDLTGKSLDVIVDRNSGENVDIITGSDVTIGGDDGNEIRFNYTLAISELLGTRNWALRDTDSPLTVYQYGTIQVIKVARK